MAGADVQLHDTYTAWKMKAEEGGNVKFQLGSEVVAIRERSSKGVKVAWKKGDEIVEGVFDELILAIGKSFRSLLTSRSPLIARCRRGYKAARQMCDMA
jgi:hypothetical protein